MEHIYLKENSCWASDEIHLDTYFNECKNVIQDIFNEDSGDSKSKLNLRNSSELASFIEDKKTSLKSPYAVSIYSMFPKLEIPSFDVSNLQKTFIINRRYEFQSACINSAFSQDSLERKKRYNLLRQKMRNFLKYGDYMSGNQNLFVFKDTVVSRHTPYSEILLEVQIFSTSLHATKWVPQQACQSILVLGSQPLSVLPGRVRCVNNYTDVAGDVSDDPSIPPTATLKDTFNSSLLYLGNSFYTDGDRDYSEVIRQWGARKKLSLGESFPMATTLFRDLKIRLNYPYLFQHLGDCEHTVMFTEARFLEGGDEANPSLYPIVKNYEDPNFQRCYICANYLARWIVRNSQRLVYDYNPMCDTCFKKYNYIKGKKVGEFEAYRILLDWEEQPVSSSKESVPSTSPS